MIIPTVEFEAKISRMGKLIVPNEHLGKAVNNYGVPHLTNEEVEKYLLDLKVSGDSCGGEVRLQIRNCPPGLGEPAFDKLKSDLSKALMSIGAVVGVTLGAGLDFLEKSGQEISKDSTNFGELKGVFLEMKSV